MASSEVVSVALGTAGHRCRPWPIPWSTRKRSLTSLAGGDGSIYILYIYISSHIILVILSILKCYQLFGCEHAVDWCVILFLSLISPNIAPKAGLISVQCTVYTLSSWFVFPVTQTVATHVGIASSMYPSMHTCFFKTHIQCSNINNSVLMCSSSNEKGPRLEYILMAPTANTHRNKHTPSPPAMHSHSAGFRQVLEDPC